jgi:hypothetical protein
MSDPQLLKNAAKTIFEKKNQANAPIFTEVRDYFLTLVNALVDAGYQSRRGFGNDTKEDKGYRTAWISRTHAIYSAGMTENSG